MNEATPVEITLARMEGKLDATMSTLGRHDESLSAHATEAAAMRDRVVMLEATITALQQQVADMPSLRAEVISLRAAESDRRQRPSWTAVVSAIVATVAVLMMVAQQLYG